MTAASATTAPAPGVADGRVVVVAPGFAAAAASFGDVLLDRRGGGERGRDEEGEKVSKLHVYVVFGLDWERETEREI